MNKDWLLQIKRKSERPIIKICNPRSKFNSKNFKKNNNNLNNTKNSSLK